MNVSRQRLDQRREPLKHDARVALNLAIRSGRIVRPEQCEQCGQKGTVEGHHPDYAKPLEVNWLCPRCHYDVHIELRRALGLGRKKQVRKSEQVILDSEELCRVMSALGKIGGSKSSDRKTKAARKNAKKPRPMRWKLCPNCEGGLSETDKQAGYCTQCGASLKNK